MFLVPIEQTGTPRWRRSRSRFDSGMVPRAQIRVDAGKAYRISHECRDCVPVLQSSIDQACARGTDCAKDDDVHSESTLNVEAASIFFDCGGSLSALLSSHCQEISAGMPYKTSLMRLARDKANAVSPPMPNS
jgi:hypothetical protein